MVSVCSRIEHTTEQVFPSTYYCEIMKKARKDLSLRVFYCFTYRLTFFQATLSKRNFPSDI